MIRQRFFQLVTTALLTLTLCGCIDEQDLDECSVDVTLLFDYTVNGQDRFDETVNTVDVFIFDGNGVYLFTQRLNKFDLDAFQGAHLTLPPGEYKVLAWANVSDHSRFSPFVPGVTTMDECYVRISSTTTGDPLYYAPGTGSSANASPYTLNLPAGESVTKELEFARAHRTVNVYIKGIETTQNGSVTAPTVNATGLWSEYNFYFETQPGGSNYEFFQQAALTSTPDGQMHLASFDSDFGEITDNTVITVRNSLGEVVATINLKQYLLDNPSANGDDINILITFLTDLGVTITLPTWANVNVTPGIN
jgi:hypothetical protein